MRIKIKKIDPEAKLPTHGHQGDAGLDFYSLHEAHFAIGGQVRIHTGITLEIPDGYVGLIWDKSSVSFNHGLKVMGGVIDACYRGEIIISLVNVSNKEYTLPKGHKVAQMIVQKFEYCELEEVENLSETIRGEGREGSTGHQ